MLKLFKQWTMSINFLFNTCIIFKWPFIYVIILYNIFFSNGLKGEGKLTRNVVKRWCVATPQGFCRSWRKSGPLSSFARHPRHWKKRDQRGTTLRRKLCTENQKWTRRWFLSPKRSLVRPPSCGPIHVIYLCSLVSRPWNVFPTLFLRWNRRYGQPLRRHLPRKSGKASSLPRCLSPLVPNPILGSGTPLKKTLLQPRRGGSFPMTPCVRALTLWWRTSWSGRHIFCRTSTPFCGARKDLGLRDSFFAFCDIFWPTCVLFPY